MIYANSFRAEARDAERLKTIKELGLALDAYAIENPKEGWPDDLNTGSNELFNFWGQNAYGSGENLPNLLSGYYNNLPEDPLNDIGHLYWYRKCTAGDCCTAGETWGDFECDPNPGEGILATFLERGEDLPVCGVGGANCAMSGGCFETSGSGIFNNIGKVCILE